MIVVTGAAGFIGSCLVKKLNKEGYTQLVLVDDFSHEKKMPNWQNTQYALTVERNVFEQWFLANAQNVEAVFHLGARTDTTETNVALFDELNLHYSQMVWNICAQNDIHLVYASSAATYGLAELGFDDNHAEIPSLKPLNPYGDSKQQFDIWALAQKNAPMFWAGLKFFNVYGPNEYHKGRMASVVMHTLNQIKATGEMKLFRSHRPDFADGQQMRDFVYVKDVVNVIYFLWKEQPNAAIYNLGSGKARSFLDLATLTFEAAGITPKISFVDTPIDIRDTYQYFTEAKMDKLIKAGYNTPFHTLEEGVFDYVQQYLLNHSYF